MFNVRSFITLGAASILMVMPLYLKAQEDTSQPAAESVPAADATAPETAAPAPAPADASAPPAATATPSTPAVLASADGENSGVRVEVTELKRSSGDTVNLKFVLINDSDEQFSVASNYLGDGQVGSDYRSVGGVHLIDPAGKKKYLVVRDTDKNCLCSGNIANVDPKKRVNLWAKFPAPPADVQKVNIVIPHFSPMDDVPISQ